MVHPARRRGSWNTEYDGLSLRTLVGEGQPIDDAFVAHLSPAALDHINLYGMYTVDVDAEFRRTDYQLLRTPDVI